MEVVTRMCAQVEIVAAIDGEFELVFGTSCSSPVTDP